MRIISGRWPCLLKHHKICCDPYIFCYFLAVRWHDETSSFEWEADRAIASPNFSFPGIWDSRGWQIKRLVRFFNRLLASVLAIQCKLNTQHYRLCGHFSTKTTYVSPSVYIRAPKGVNLPILEIGLLGQCISVTYPRHARTTWPETHRPLTFFHSTRRSPEQILPLQRNVR